MLVDAQQAARMMASEVRRCDASINRHLAGICVVFL
jgi:hypothetical protein